MGKSFNAEELLTDARWVRELARSLAIDRSAADDLVHETWLAVLREAPKHMIFSPRAWFRRVLLNEAGHDAHRSALRAERERGAARPEALPSTVELAERAELQRALAAAVLALAEPYRSTILWRYFGDLNSEEIARRLGVSSSTVRNRLRRGLDLLRSALERRGVSDWQARCLALGTFKSMADGANFIHKGVVMGTKVKLGLAIVAALAASLVLWI